MVAWGDHFFLLTKKKRNFAKYFFTRMFYILGVIFCDTLR